MQGCAGLTPSSHTLQATPLQDLPLEHEYALDEQVEGAKVKCVNTEKIEALYTNGDRERGNPLEGTQ